MSEPLRIRYGGRRSRESDSSFFSPLTSCNVQARVSKHTDRHRPCQTWNWKAPRVRFLSLSARQLGSELKQWTACLPDCQGCPSRWGDNCFLFSLWRDTWCVPVGFIGVAQTHRRDFACVFLSPTRLFHRYFNECLKIQAFLSQEQKDKWFLLAYIFILSLKEMVMGLWEEGQERGT